MSSKQTPIPSGNVTAKALKQIAKPVLGGHKKAKPKARKK